MSPHRPKSRTIWRVKVPTRHGWVDRSTGSRDKSIAKAMDRMLEDLGPRGKRSWDLLDRVADSTLTLGRLYDAWRLADLDTLRAELADVDLGPFIPRWQDYLVGRVSDGERDRYLHHVRGLAGVEGTPFPRSSVTSSRLEAWLTGLPVGPSTQRKYHAALSSFLTYCRAVHRLFDRDPMADLAPPPANAPRVEYYDLPEVRRILGASPEPWQSLYALLYGTAIEVTTALDLRRRDVDLQAREIRARGTKAHNRDRIASIASWSLPWITRLVADKLPDAPLFPKMDRWRANKKHAAVAKELELRVLRVHDARHHWAVRQLRAGVPIELVSRQLGHANAVMALRIYGRFIPTTADRHAWDAKVEAGG
jgi:integrase